jgi:hypothetical protein
MAMSIFFSGFCFFNGARPAQTRVVFEIAAWTELWLYDEGTRGYDKSEVGVRACARRRTLLAAAQRRPCRQAHHYHLSC